MTSTERRQLRRVGSRRTGTRVKITTACLECGSEVSTDQLIEDPILSGDHLVVLCVGRAHGADTDVTVSGWIGGDLFVG